MKKYSHLVFWILLLMLIVTTYISLVTGKLPLSVEQLITKITTGNEPKVDAVIDLRMPRIIIAIFVGAVLSVSGALLQAVLQNPLAEANIIGVTSGALVARGVILIFLPSLYFFLPIFIFIGGLIPFLVLFLLVSRYHITPIRLILVGVAIYAMLNGVLELFSMSPVMQLPTGFTMKVWQDVYIIVAFSIVGLTIAYMLAEKVNLLSFDDKQANNIGFNITKYRLIIGLVAVFLASSATAIVGQLAFVGLIVPHIVRRLVGSNYKKVIPISMVFGAWIVLLADTLGKSIAPPLEISASIITTVIGGPCLIYLICKGAYGNANRER